MCTVYTPVGYSGSHRLKKITESDNIVVMWIVLIRENVTASVSGRIDKGTEEET